MMQGVFKKTRAVAALRCGAVLGLACAIAVMSASCAEIRPQMRYESDMEVTRSPLKAKILVEADPNALRNGLDSSSLASFRASLVQDMRENGPFAISEGAPDVILTVRFTDALVEEPSGAGSLLWIAYPLPIMGIPYGRTDLDFRADVTLRDTRGRLLHESMITASDAEMHGLYYQTATYEDAALQLGESLRSVLANDMEAIASRHAGNGPALAARPKPPTPAAPTKPAPTQPVAPAAPLKGLLTGAPQPTAYALIVGVEDYRDIPDVPGAKLDAERFRQLAQTTLNIPAKNIRMAVDQRATRTDIEKQLLWLKKHVRPGSRVYFFFSGHGSPDTANGTPYLMPYDGDPAFIKRTGLPMRDVLAQLDSTKAREVLVFVDSCFSGSGGRSVLPEGARPLVPVKAEAPKSRLALFASSSAEEISGPVPKGQGGLFTHYIIQGIGTGAADLDGDGQVALSELETWVKPRVSREALKVNRKQNPTLKVGKQLGEAAAVMVTWGLPPR